MIKLLPGSPRDDTQTVLIKEINTPKILSSLTVVFLHLPYSLVTTIQDCN